MKEIKVWLVIENEERTVAVYDNSIAAREHAEISPWYHVCDVPLLTKFIPSYLHQKGSDD